MSQFTPIEYLVPNTHEISALYEMQKILVEGTEISRYEWLKDKRNHSTYGYSFHVLGNVEIQLIQLTDHLTKNYLHLGLPEQVVERLEEDKRSRPNQKGHDFREGKSYPLFILVDVDNRLDSWVIRQLGQRILSYHGGYIPRMVPNKQERMIAFNDLASAFHYDVDMKNKDVFKGFTVETLG